MFSLQHPPVSAGSFLIHSLTWHADGEAILLMGKDQMCVCFLSPSQVNASAAHNTSTIHGNKDDNKLISDNRLVTVSDNRSNNNHDDSQDVTALDSSDVVEEIPVRDLEQSGGEEKLS